MYSIWTALTHRTGDKTIIIWLFNCTLTKTIFIFHPSKMALRACFFLSLFAIVLADLPANYESFTAVQKQEILWQNINTEPYGYDNLPTAGPTPEQLGAFMSLNYTLQSFLHVSDEMPIGRTKVVHPYGPVAKGRMVIYSNSHYTGIFAPGTRRVLIRPSTGFFDQFDPSNLGPGRIWCENLTEN